MKGTDPTRSAIASRLAKSRGSTLLPSSIIPDAEITAFALGQERQEAGGTAIEKADAPEIPVHWSVSDIILQKRKVRFSFKPGYLAARRCTQ